MTKLEEEIDYAIMQYSDRLIRQEAITAAAEVAKRYIEKALHDAYCNGAADGSHAAKSQNYNNIGSNQHSKDWLKENGIV